MIQVSEKARTALREILSAQETDGKSARLLIDDYT
jgi:hypothetical protein